MCKGVVQVARRASVPPRQAGVQDLPRAALRNGPCSGCASGQPSRLTTNEWYKAAQLGDSYWLYVVWDPLDNPSPEPLRIPNPVKHLDYAKREVVAARYYDIPAEAVETAAQRGGER